MRIFDDCQPLLQAGEPAYFRHVAAAFQSDGLVPCARTSLITSSTRPRTSRYR